jgi:translation initiation factor IF-2
LSKIKVHELAKELNISNNELIGKLNDIGIKVKTHLSTLSESELKKFKGDDKMSKKESDVKKETTPHIIRRNVKVINTDNDRKEIEQITTNISGEIKKSHQTIKNEVKNDYSYSKEGLGVVTPKNFNNRNNRGFVNNRNMNVVVTRNGKSITQESSLETVKKDQEIENNIDNKIPSNNIQTKQEDVQNVNLVENKPSENNNQDYNRNNNYRPYNRDNNNTQGNNNNYRPYNRDNNTQGNNNNYRPYNRDNNTQGNNNNYRPYNRDNNNTQGNNSNYRPYNRDNNNTQGNNSNYRPYNRDNNNTQGNNSNYRPYNRDNNNTQGNNSNYRPYNRDNNTQGNNNNYRPYNNQNNGGFRNRNVTPVNQVDKFMKQTSENTEVVQKEKKDYTLTLIDKKKVNTSNTNDGKKQSINKNQLREKHTRVSTSTFKGLEVNSSGGMLDLYERGTDLFKKGKRKKEKKQQINQNLIIPMTEVKLPEIMTVKEFSEMLKKQSSEVIKKLFALGILANVNQEIDFDTAFLIAQEFGITAEKQVVVTEEDILFDDSEDLDENMEARPPIVVVMGHVDHGKTSLLDRIRKASVVTGEAGGITQHIGAYKVNIHDKEICFLDTPGHEAFTAMRARGASVTDIAIIVVAADDGIKPQTIEAIDHAKAANVSIIVAINKIDKPTANIEKVKQELLEVGLIAEEWGGETICVPISAMTGEGIENLLEMVLLTAEMKDLKANPNKQAKGTVIEAKLDKNVGTITSLLIQRGTLNVGDTIVVGDMIGKVRAMKDDKGKKVKLAGPSTPVEIIGLPSVPETGDTFYEVENEKVAKQLISKRKADIRKNLIKQGSKVTLDDLFGQIKEGQIKDLNVIIKADVQGTLEALKNSLEKISNEEVKVRIIHASTGGIKESDVTLASVSNAIIIGFNVRPESVAQSQAEKEKVDLRLYRVIYDAINDVEAAIKGMLKPTFKEVIHGTAEVRAIFKITNVGTIAGCYVKTGSIVRNKMVRIIRDSIVLTEVKLESLKREKEDVKEVKFGYECGIKLEKFDDILENDIVECFELVEEKRG